MLFTKTNAIVGIVGSEAAKFTPASREAARELILEILSGPDVTEVVSGGCHLGGIDQWAAEIGKELGLTVTEFLPKTHSWASGYMPRNLLIAQHSDIVHCITVDHLPPKYDGMTFKLCYHCKTDTHVKSGGCWTMMQARKIGKPGVLHVVENVGEKESRIRKDMIEEGVK